LDREIQSANQWLSTYICNLPNWTRTLFGSNFMQQKSKVLT